MIECEEKDRSLRLIPIMQNSLLIMRNLAGRGLPKSVGCSEVFRRLLVSGRATEARSCGVPDDGADVVEDPNVRLERGFQWLPRPLCCDVPLTIMAGKGTEVALWATGDVGNVPKWAINKQCMQVKKLL